MTKEMNQLIKNMTTHGILMRKMLTEKKMMIQRKMVLNHMVKMMANMTRT
jgi:hypothetical protein